MYKIPIILAYCLFFFQIRHSTAQNKYSIIIGINKYYTNTNTLSSRCLKGCVNDALSIRSLLMQRFDFRNENITMFLDANATQDNIVNSLNRILAKAKSGDVFVFYFCGHGIYINNSKNLEDGIKRGYNQAICLSNLYAPNLDCLMKDNTLKKWFNNFVEKKVIVTSIFDCCFSGTLAMGAFTKNPYCDRVAESSNDIAKNIDFDEIVETSRSYDMGKTLSIEDVSIVPRPSDKKNSKFASISAASQYEIARETYDESGNPHGALTKAIIDIYKKNKTDVSFSEILPTISKIVKTVQQFDQTPTFHFDSSRIAQNLVGLPLQNRVSYFPIYSKRGDTLVINAGSNSNLAKGNKLNLKRGAMSINIVLEKVYADSAIAISKSSSKVNIKDSFGLISCYTSSAPFLKIYISSLDASAGAFSNVFWKSVFPYTQMENYMYYYNWNTAANSYSYIFRDKRKIDKILSEISHQNAPFYMHYYIPSDISTSIKKALSKDQNIQLVSSEKNADLVVYLDYSPISEFTGKPVFVFFLRPPLPKESVNVVEGQEFCVYHADTQDLQLTKTQLITLTTNIRLASYKYVRNRGTQWLNLYEKE